MLFILEISEIPRGDENSVDGDVDGKIIGVSVRVAVHRSDYALPSADQKTGGTVDIVRPAGHRLLPNRNDYARPDMTDLSLVASLAGSVLT